MNIRKITYGHSLCISVVLMLVASFKFSYAQKAVGNHRPLVVWREAETNAAHNFRPGPIVDIKDHETVSGQEYLQLADYQDKNNGETPRYYSAYKINIPANDTYVLWIAASPQDGPQNNPITVILNRNTSFDLSGKQYASVSYGENSGKTFGWLKVGPLKLSKGENTIKFQINPQINHQFVARLDAFFLTTDLEYAPEGPLPSVSPNAKISDLLKTQSVEAIRNQMQYRIYQTQMLSTWEDIGDASSKDVLARLRKRRLPDHTFINTGPQEFGVHGMETPFVRKGVDSVKIGLAYELLARAGVSSFRTAESCWHRLGENYNDYSELDYQVKNATRYGMTHLFTVGYPPAKFTRSRMNLAAVNPIYEKDYRNYLHNLISRYKDQGLRYVELANEVDAPNVWWHNSSPLEYVEEMRMLKEETRKLSATIKTVGFAATYSRNEELGGTAGGRRFVDSCFAHGIDQYADSYSLHYTWPLSQQGFVDYFRSKLSESGSPTTPLLNTEETTYGKPCDIIKSFARNFFLYDMKRVDYYLARDWFEAGNMLFCGLFDIDWNPKKRLLAYAASVDAMRNRELVGLARPAANIEAYVLRTLERESGSKYVIVIWQNGKTRKESIEPDVFNGFKDLSPIAVSGFKGRIQVEKWNLDLTTYKNAPVKINVTDEPLIIYTDVVPDWKLLNRAQFLKNTLVNSVEQKGLLPGQ